MAASYFIIGNSLFDIGYSEHSRGGAERAEVKTPILKAHTKTHRHQEDWVWHASLFKKRKEWISQPFSLWQVTRISNQWKISAFRALLMTGIEYPISNKECPIMKWKSVPTPSSVPDLMASLLHHWKFLVRYWIFVSVFHSFFSPFSTADGSKKWECLEAETCPVFYGLGWACFSSK